MSKRHYFNFDNSSEEMPEEAFEEIESEDELVEDIPEVFGEEPAVEVQEEAELAEELNEDTDETEDEKADLAVVARAVISGRFGKTKEEIQEALEAEGYNYEEVQAVKLAILNGTYF